MSQITKTRQVDRFGNVSYLIQRDGETIGVVAKTCGAWQAELLSGSYMPAKSIKDGVALLTR